MQILKKDGRLENYDFNKIKIAVQKSAARVDIQLNEDQLANLESEILLIIIITPLVRYTIMSKF